MKRILAGLLGAAVVAGPGAALAQPYGYYAPGYDAYRYNDGRYNDGRYYDEGWRHDNGRHLGWYKHRRHYGYGYYVPYRRHYYGYGYAPVRVCAWQYGERVCWWRY